MTLVRHTSFPYLVDAMLRAVSCSLVLFGLVSATATAADATIAAKLSAIRTPADLDRLIAASDAGLAKVLKEHSVAILAAAAEHESALQVAKTVEAGKGKTEPLNTTPEPLMQAAGGEVALFDTLKVVDLAVVGMGPHDKRPVDPYDAEFFECLGRVSSLESLNVISTKLNDEGIARLAGLKKLKTLRFTNNGKLSDAGLATLAGLKHLEAFSFVGTGMKGHAFASFDGWDRLARCSFRGSSIDDEGLKNICEQFPNLESISLAHAKFTDAGAVYLAKLKKLKGLEIGSRNATPDCLKHLADLPLEYLQLGDGLDAPAGIAAVRGISSLRRLTLTNCKMLSDEELKLVTALTQLDQLELGGLPLSDERLPQLKGFAFLKSLQLVNRPAGYPEEIRTQITALLPKVEVKFVQ